jgi:thiosulfate/3-mercaptopyruvate sulfurtransferase
MGVLPAATIPTFLLSGTVLDARAAERYRGDVEPMDPVPGHIPGTVNLPTVSLADPEGRFLDDDALLARLDEAGIAPDAPLASSCGSGVTAAHQVLALALLGRDALLVPESYSWWCRQPDRAVAKGSSP